MKIKKALMLIFMLVALTAGTVYGSDAAGVNIGKVNLGESYVFSQNTSGSSFFFMSQSNFLNRHKGSLVFFKSSSIIKGKIEGNIYCLFSELVMEKEAIVSGNIYTLSSIVSVHGNASAKVKAFIVFEKLFSNIYSINGYKVYSDVLPAMVIIVFLSVSREFICLVLLGFKKGFFEQGSVLILKEPFSILHYGLFSYFILIALSLMFLMSVVGVAIAVLIGIFVFLISLNGQVSLNMTMGDLITNQLNIKAGPYVNAVIGGIISEIMTFLPVVGLIFNFILMPILCLGIFFTNIVNGFIRKRFYETPYDLNINYNKNPGTDDIRNIVVKDIK